MKLFNAFLGTLTAGLLAATLALTTASWIDGPDAADVHVASAENPVLVQSR